MFWRPSCEGVRGYFPSAVARASRVGINASPMYGALFQRQKIIGPGMKLSFHGAIIVSEGPRATTSFWTAGSFPASTRSSVSHPAGLCCLAANFIHRSLCGVPGRPSSGSLAPARSSALIRGTFFRSIRPTAAWYSRLFPAVVKKVDGNVYNGASKFAISFSGGLR